MCALSHPASNCPGASLQSLTLKRKQPIPSPLADPSFSQGVVGTLWCVWTSCPWGLQNAGFLPNCAGSCVLAGHFSPNRGSCRGGAAERHSYCVWPQGLATCALSWGGSFCSRLSLSKARGLLSERLLEPGQTCMDPGTVAGIPRMGMCSLLDSRLRAAHLSANVIFTAAL